MLLQSTNVLDLSSSLQHPYKYAGYPMLIKTIRMETDDEKLFSKSAPLLAAASECAYFTVKCSALNAEEMRRENGLVFLYQVWKIENRSVFVINSENLKIDLHYLIHLIKEFQDHMYMYFKMSKLECTCI